jgi:hypothetical protein
MKIVYWNKDTELIQSYSHCPIRWEQTLVPPFRGCIHIRLDSPSLQAIHPDLYLGWSAFVWTSNALSVFINNLYILPVTTPTKATYYTCKLSSHITRFTLFILDYQHVSQVFMHSYYHNYCHRTTNHYRYIAPQGRSHSKNLVTFVRLEDPSTR